MINLKEGWHLKSAVEINAGGEKISTQTFSTDGWYPTSVPNTVLATLIENDVYKDVYYANNLDKIPMIIFETGWWYRKEFSLKGKKAKTIRLRFNGLNYRANIWLNGQQIAPTETVYGTFRTWDFDVSEYVNDDINVLAVETFKPQPGDFRLGFADWNPRPQDRCMGIWREVFVEFSDEVSIKNPFISSELDVETYEKADILVQTDVENHCSEAINGVLKVKIEAIEIEKRVSLAPKEKKEIRLTPCDFKELHFKNPRVWWPHNMGEANLYDAEVSFEVEGKVSDKKQFTFGIRKVTDYLTEEGFRGYIINGHKTLIKGAGWTDNMFLMESPEHIEAQVLYVKHMGLNCIRLEGIWGKTELMYDLCDKHGVLIMAGWSCQWEWEGQLGKPCDEFMGAETEEEMNLVNEMTRDQVIWLRNHPCVFTWVLGSDKLPRPALEHKFIEMMDKEIDLPYCMSAKDWTSEVTGPSAMKMRGPYDYCPPVYWYRDHKKGGAYGFNTETGPGPQPNPLESIKKFIPKENLWPIDDMWNYHCARGVPLFNSLDTYKEALDKRYGESSNVEEFLTKSQMQSYEAMRGMYEAFTAYKPKATGVIQWMLNSAWPSMFWQLYDTYLMPNGAFYGAKKACQYVHLIYDYDKKEIYAINETHKQIDGLTAEIRFFDIESKELQRETVEVNLSGNESIVIKKLQKPKGLTTTYFLNLKLYNDKGEEINTNLYWLSTKDDGMDYTDIRFHHLYTPMSSWGNLRGINNLPKANVDVKHDFKQVGDKTEANITMENKSDKIAFFIELRLVGEKSDESALPVFLSDNYVSLLPGETRKITGHFATKGLKGEKPVLKYSGINI